MFTEDAMFSQWTETQESAARILNASSSEHTRAVFTHGELTTSSYESGKK